MTQRLPEEAGAEPSLVARQAADQVPGATGDGETVTSSGAAVMTRNDAPLAPPGRIDGAATTHGEGDELAPGPGALDAGETDLTGSDSTRDLR